MAYTAAIITVSDNAYRGTRTDTSGPALQRILQEQGWDIIYYTIVPDEFSLIQGELLHCADRLGVNLVLTTGGTGFSPRDITPEATMKVVQRLAPGIGEAMRSASLAITPRASLSRSIAGIRNRTLIINLPGSEKAAKENIHAVLASLKHGVDMLCGTGSADCAETVPVQEKAAAPSLDEWLKEAKSHPDWQKVGMYLFHNGIVRQTPKAQVRQGKEGLPQVIGMNFSYDEKKLEQAIAAAYEMEGIYYVRAWLNRGELALGDDIMLLLVGGDIRPHVVEALQFLLGEIKGNCVKEEEIFSPQ